MPNKKIACLGGGSGYFARALPDLAVTPGLAGSDVALYDIELEKCELMARHGQRLAEQAATGQRVHACATLAEALDGADFAITSIGGAGASVGNVYGTGYHVQDILIPARYGIYQIVGDTGGPAGMMMALRSIPIYIDICHEMEKRCPRAILFNHSNPMAVLCRAMLKYTGIQVVGVCHGVQIGLIKIGQIMNIDPREIDALWVGTNHYHWFTRLYHQGKDIYPAVKERLAAFSKVQGEIMTNKLSQIYGYQIVYPEDDHALEFYPFLTQLPDGEHLPYEQKAWLPNGYTADPAAQHEPSATERAEARQQQLSEMEERLGQIELPAAMSDPITGEGLGGLLQAIAQGRREVHIVNIPNQGAVPNLPAHAVLEIEAVTDSCGLRGIYMGEAPLVLAGLLQKRIVWQELVADAAVKGDRQLALQALLMDEMAIVPEKAEAMLDELLAASRPMLPQFSA